MISKTKAGKTTIANNKLNPEQEISKPRKMTEADFKASLTPAQQADYDQDTKDARLETWLSDQGREEESNRVYERRMARAARRGDFGPGAVGPVMDHVASQNASAQAAFKAAWDQELARERSRQAVDAAFGPTKEIDWSAAQDAAMAAAEIEVIKIPAEEMVVPTVKTPKVFDGTYTLISPKGGHRTLRIRRQGMDNKFKPGVSLVGLLTGRDNENDYTNFGHVQDDGTLRVWAKHENTDTAKIGAVLFALLKGDAAGQRFAAAGYSVEVSKRCFRCHRVLTHPTSLSSGYGPECEGR